jgi:transcriptional regulator with XRE-family HTH domain
MDAKTLNSIRLNLGLSQIQFAARLGLSRQATISDYERGQNPIPETVAILASLLSERRTKSVQKHGNNNSESREK